MDVHVPEPPIRTCHGNPQRWPPDGIFCAPFPTESMWLPRTITVTSFCRADPFPIDQRNMAKSQHLLLLLWILRAKSRKSRTAIAPIQTSFSHRTHCVHDALQRISVRYITAVLILRDTIRHAQTIGSVAGRHSSGRPAVAKELAIRNAPHCPVVPFPRIRDRAAYKNPGGP